MATKRKIHHRNRKTRRNRRKITNKNLFRNLNIENVSIEKYNIIKQKKKTNMIKGLRELLSK